ncbi:MAG: hypothetical protein QMD71_08875 [bacterium]|nr:hypothetical protein [bacterium]
MRFYIPTLIQAIGGRFSKELGIRLEGEDSAEIFKWWLASILFAARIGERIAVNTYKEFERSSVISAQKIVDTGWDGLVRILDAGGYVRYDFKTATKLLNVMDSLIKEYKGDLNLLHRMASNPSDLEIRLKNLGKGIGDVTVNIFLRELREIWTKANTLPQQLVLIASKNMGLSKSENPSEVLQDLESIWRRQNIKSFTFPDFEVSLLRLAKNYCQKNKCQLCLVKEVCVKIK